MKISTVLIGMLAGAAASALAADAMTLNLATWDKHEAQVRFTVKDIGSGLRAYTQASTMPMRDNGPSSIDYREWHDQPRVRSGNIAFDALFALAVDELKKASVSEIRDDSYNGGKPIACDCFETGEKWHYVWTRDTAYAAWLGTALLDPQRARNSLIFKLSGNRAGLTPPAGVAGSADGLQIIQDTGSGGSWPVSTDRVSWAFGAQAVLQALPAAERKVFAATAFKALRNTIENDRLAAFDAADGLYTGEQSFLDWREQSYAAWISQDLSSMASAKALSTNVAHYQALLLASRLADEQGDAALAARYADWAAQLKSAINAAFWLEDAGLYSSLTAGHGDGAPLHKFDWLGQSLAIVTGIADAGRASRILASYPHGPYGPPVIYPQQPNTPIYHNRAIWPFVTAFGLHAAALGRNTAVADAAYDSLMRAAALHLSNMENLEWLSGQTQWHDPKHADLDGPVINSRRQLWSVGAYLGMVIRDVFGVTTTDGGIVLQPFMTARLRREQFGAASHITLDNLRLHGNMLRIDIVLPPAANADGYYAIDTVMLNGRKAASSIPWKRLQAHNHIEIRLGALQAGSQAIRRVDGDPFAIEAGAANQTFAPYEAQIGTAGYNAAGAITIDIRDDRNPKATMTYRIYRNGKPLAENLAAGVWTDASPVLLNCYTVEAIDVQTGNRSHHSEPACLGAEHEEREIELENRHTDAPVTIERAGRYRFQVRYRNLTNSITTGTTNGVKWLTIFDGAGKIVARRVIQMPHTRDGTAHYSTPLETSLAPGIYRAELGDFINMSYLQSNASYSGPGGASGPVNHPDAYSLRIVAVE